MHTPNTAVKRDGVRPLGKRRWQDNIKMQLRETAREVADWIEIAQDMRTACEYGNELSDRIKGGNFLTS
jgi:hypothetical protein